MGKEKYEFFKGWDFSWADGQNCTTRVMSWELHKLLDLGPSYQYYLYYFSSEFPRDKKLEYKEWKDFMNE